MRKIKKNGIGIGLRIPHYQEIFSQKPKLDFFEIISENFMFTEGLPRKNLDKILRDYPVVLHGTSMGLGSIDPLNETYLKALKNLIQSTETPYFTDHLCWESAHGKHFHDLLPMPYTMEYAHFIASKIAYVQDKMGIPFGIENLSSYVEFSNSEMNEWEFYNEVIQKSGAFYMLDINNIYVSAVNHQFDPRAYLDSINWQRVLQCHIAGHTQNANGTILDTHDAPVCPEVWELYHYAWEISGGFKTLLEWDDHFVSLKETVAEVEKALPLQVSHSKPSPSSEVSEKQCILVQNPPQNLIEFQENFAKVLSMPIDFESGSFRFQKENYPPRVKSLMVPRHGLSGDERLEVYNQQYWYRLLTVLQKDYPLLCNHLSVWEFNQVASEYLTKYPSNNQSLNVLSYRFPQFIAEHSILNSILIRQIVELEHWYRKTFHQKMELSLLEQFQDSLELEKLLSQKIKISPQAFFFSEDFNIMEHFVEELKGGNSSTPYEEQQKYWFCNRVQGKLKILPCEKIPFVLLKELNLHGNLDLAFERLLAHPHWEESMQKQIPIWFKQWAQNGVFVQ